MPKKFVEAMSVKKGDTLELVSSENGDWILRNAKPKYDLDTLLKEHVTDNNVDAWGSEERPVGLELL